MGGEGGRCSQTCRWRGGKLRDTSELSERVGVRVNKVSLREGRRKGVGDEVY